MATKSEKSDKQSQKIQKKKGKSTLLSLIFTIALPIFILSTYSGQESLGPVNALLAALFFPLLFALHSTFIEKKVDMVSVLGLLNVLLTGGIGLLALDPQVLAIKEASIPLVIALSILLSMKTKTPLVRTFLFNDAIFHIDKINERLKEKNNMGKFERIMVYASYGLAASFLISAVLNYVLARIVVSSPAGTEAFNQELARMTALSYPVIALPSTVFLIIILFSVMYKLKKFTGYSFEDMMIAGDKIKEKEERRKE